MEYVYAAILLHEADEELNEENITGVLEGAGIDVEESRVKALVAALEDVDIEEAIETAAGVPAAGGAGGSGGAAASTDEAETDEEPEADEEADEAETEEEDDDDDEEASGEGLGNLFG
jgi:large subunit ribosomal protein L12